jgi:hypothetical protein
MCLYINREQSQNEKDLKRWFGSRKRFAYVYKVLRKNEDEDFYRSFHYCDYIWNFRKQKVYQVDRDSDPTEEELDLREIDFGFHVYTSLEEAKAEYSSYNYYKPDSAVVKFRVSKKDFVAVDYFEDTAVCRKLEFVKVLED